MGNQLYGGTLGDFDSSDNMAREIQNAFVAMRASAGIIPRRMFSSVSNSRCA